ncbi:hypothetical protein [Halosolutus gelatinilyticus]|uniref:hypothetical protein n=1 Tax=Halosolutus gelatinilyticus TaxID=2931975 RepID=UPI001FF12365|nr:hypothetical protein [Halosolutus gelatinilyticus]
MAVTNADTTDAIAGALGATTTIDLAALGLDVPSGTTVDLTCHGERSSFVIELERRGDSWTVEGARNAAEVTALRAPGKTIADVERVPSWIERVLAEFEIKEVQLAR